MAAVIAKSSILLVKNILTETCKTSDQVLMDCGRGKLYLSNILYVAAYTTARSVYHTKVFRLSQHIDRLCISLFF